MEDYYVLKGRISTYGDKLISERDEIFVINKNIDINITHIFYSYVTPFCNSSVGLIFEIDKLELKNDYLYQKLMIEENKCIENYNINSTYKMGVSFNPQSGKKITSINDKLIFSTIDKVLKGNRVGFISLDKNTIFKQILSKEV